MKKTTIGLACVCMYVLAASCEIPESVTLKGSPGVYLPLGSPFVLMKEEDRLENYLNSDKIKEMMSVDDDSIEIYEYTGNVGGRSNVETYVIRYPITEMELDLQDYIDSKTEDEDTHFTATIPSNIANPPGSFPANGYHIFRDSNNTVKEQVVQNQSTDTVNPLFTIVLTDMAKLVKEITGGPFGLELDYKQEFEDYIRIKIPALGINTYIQGSDETIEGERKLRFVNDTPYTSSDPLKPREALDINDELGIYVIALGPCSGTIEPKMVFEWEEALIDTSQEAISNTYTLDNSALKDFFGDDIKFKEAQGYVYVGGVNNTASMSLRVAGASSNLVTDASLTERAQPSFSNGFSQLPDQSLDNTIDLTAALNASIANAVDLEYDLTIDERWVVKDDLDKNEIVFADLVILLPLEFTTSVPPDDNRYADYAKLKLEGLFLDLGEEDLFQRKGNDDDLFNALKTVKFILSNLKNDILGGEIYILVSAGDKAGLLNLQQKNPSVEFDIGNLPPPFAPQFEILIKKDKPADVGAPFWLKRKPSGNNKATFDFSLAIQAKTDINQTISIPGL